MENSQTSSGKRQEQVVPTEIHDAFAGLFTAILMRLQAVTDLPLNDSQIRKDCLLRAQELARTGLRQVRELVEASDLSGGQLDEFLTVMQKLISTVALGSATEGTLQVKGEKRRLKSAVCLTLQRILEEAVRNAKRYAHATTLAVELCFEEDRVVLEVNDDGDGFTPDTSLEIGFGLVSMRARVDRLGGGLWLRSSPGQGTSIRVDIPSPYANESESI